MQRTARLLARRKPDAAKLSPDEFAAAIWPAAVGKRLAARTGPVRLFGKRLAVDVEDKVWQQQLTTLGPQILAKIAQIAGAGIVEALEFRIGVPRRQPHTAATAVGDPADGIEDPIFRLLYMASRAKSDEAERLRKTA